MPILSILFPEGTFIALFCVVCAAALSFFLKKMDLSGSVAGLCIAMAMFMGGSWPALLCLLAFFVLGVGATSWKKKYKQDLRLAQEAGGKRSHRHALANGGIAALWGILAYLNPDQQALYGCMMVGSLAAAASDTVSSELGNVYGSRYVDILTFRADTRGRDGVISLEGTLAGFIASALIGLIYGLWMGSLLTVSIIAVSGLLGNLADSALGASLQRRGLMNNDAVNLANTFIGALIAAGLFSLFP